MKIKTLIITCLFIGIFSAKAENVVDKSKKTLVKNFNATKFILTPPKIALKRMNNSLDQINNAFILRSQIINIACDNLSHAILII